MAYVYKNTSVELLDAFFSGDDGLDQRYADSIELLDSTPANELVQTTLALGSDPDFAPLSALAEEAEYFQARWLVIEGAAETMKATYAEAIRIARGPVDAEGRPTREPKPLETFWVSNPEGQFEMFITESRFRVTVHVITPLENEGGPGSRNARTRSWVIRWNGERAVSEQISGPEAKD
jgi:hypothetical protein